MWNDIPKIQKMVLDTYLLNTQYYTLSIKGKVEQSKDSSIALPIPRCNHYKGAFRLPLTTVTNFTYFYYLHLKNIL